MLNKLIRILILSLLLCFCYNVYAYLKLTDQLAGINGKFTLTNQFIGITGEMQFNANTRLKIKQPEDKKLTIETIKRLNAEAPKEIALAMQPYGYFKSEITSKLSHIGNAWNATYYVNLGQPLLISNVSTNISGEAGDDPEIKKFFAHFPIQKDDILNTVKYKKVKQDFLDLAAKRGYILAKIEVSEVRIDLTQYTANIVFNCTSGPRYFFNSTVFSANPLSDKFLKKFLTYKEGEYYSTDKIHSSQANLNNSNLFKSVTIEPQYKETQDLKVPVYVNIIPRKSQQYTFGIGYGTDTGIRGLLGFELYNFASNGQHVHGLIKASAEGLKDLEGDIEISYIIPGSVPTTDQYDVSIGSNLKDKDYGKSALIKAGPGYTTNIFGWQQTLRLDIEHEWWHFTDQSTKDQSTILVPSIIWLRKKTNDPINPTAGYRVNLLLQGTSTYFGSDINFLQANLDTKWMYPIPKGPILVLRGNIGYTSISNENLDKLPMSFWFTTGGSTTIRGYNYEQIGPGKELFVGNIEFQQKLFIPQLYGSLFYDIGNAANDIFSYHSDDPFYRHQSVGLGFTYQSPVGAIRIAYAIAIDQSEAPARIQFSIGPDL